MIMEILLKYYPCTLTSSTLARESRKIRQFSLCLWWSVFDLNNSKKWTSRHLTPVILFKFYLFIYLWLRWVFVSVRGLSPVATRGDHSSWQCAGLSLSRPLLLRSTGSRRAGSVVVAHGPSCSAACGIFPDQGSNPCPLHWQADSQPLRHQGSPTTMILFFLVISSD